MVLLRHLHAQAICYFLLNFSCQEVESKTGGRQTGLKATQTNRGHESRLFGCFYGGDIRITRQKGGQPRPAAEHARAEKTRDVLVEYLFLSLFIASSGSASEISKAADCGPAPPGGRAQRALSFPHTSLVFSRILAPIPLWSLSVCCLLLQSAPWASVTELYSARHFAAQQLRDSCARQAGLFKSLSGAFPLCNFVVEW